MPAPRPSTPRALLAAATALAIAAWWRVAAPTTVPVTAAGRPASEAPAVATLSDGATFGVAITAPSPDRLHPTGDVVLRGTARTGGAVRDPRVSLALLFDVSQSSIAPAGSDCGGDLNADGLEDTVLDCEIAAGHALVERAIALGSVGEVGVGMFEKLAAPADVQPAAGIQIRTAPDADLDGNGVADLRQIIETLYWERPSFYDFRAGTRLFDPVRVGEWHGGTNLGGAVLAGCQILDNAGYPIRRAILMSDGHANKLPIVSAAFAACPDPPVFTTVAIGADAWCAKDIGGFGSLQDIADLSGGRCFRVLDPGDLPQLLPRLISPTITALSLSVDGGPPIDVTTALSEPVPWSDGAPLTFETVVPGVTADTELCVTLTVTSGPETGEVTDCVSVTIDRAPVADAGPDLEVVEGTIVTLDGAASVDPEGSPLDHAWRVLTASGPIPELTAVDHPRLAVPLLDDGVYVFELTVSDGGATSADTVTVTVTNAAPEPVLVLEPAPAGAPTVLSARLGDAGTADTHTLTVDWGDGATDTLPATVQGGGWAVITAAHVYDTPGTFPVTAAVADGDGGTVTTTLTADVDAPLAIWAHSTTAPRALEWHAGGTGEIVGRIHSNRDVRLIGTEKRVHGPISYRTLAEVDPGVALTEAPQQVPPADLPRTWDPDDYAPGGAVAALAGPDFHDLTAACTPTWTPSAPLAPGLYWAPCDVVLDGALLTGPTTLVATGTVRVEGDAVVLAPWVDGLAVLSTSPRAEAVDLVTTGASVLGHLVAPIGGIDLDGADNHLSCAVLGDRVDLSGCDLRLHPKDCDAPVDAAVPPAWTPALTVEVAASADQAHPGEAVTTTAALAYEGAWLTVPGVLTVHDPRGAHPTITAAGLTLWLGDGAGGWAPLPTAASVSVRREGDSAADTSGLGALVGATIPPEGAWWSIEAVLPLDGPTMAALMDPRRPLRLTADVQATAPVIVRGATGRDLTAALRGGGADVVDASVAIATVDGAVALRTAVDAPALARLAPSDRIVLEGIATSPILGAMTPEELVLQGIATSPILGVLTPDDVDLDGIATSPILGARRPLEDSAAYLARLARLDARPMPSFARGVGGTLQGIATSPILGASTTRRVPGLHLAAAGPPTAGVGETVSWALTLSNPSSSDGVGVVGVHAVDGERTALSLVSAVPAGGWAASDTSWTVPPSASGQDLEVVSKLLWQDGAGNTYGPVEVGSVLAVSTAGRLDGKLTDALEIDADGNGVISAGDTVRYTATLTNTGQGLLADVRLLVDVDPASTLVSGSAATSHGAVVLGLAAGDPQVGVLVGTLHGLHAATVRFDVVIADPLPAGVTELSAQGQLQASGLPPALTDDPATPGPSDPTVTRVTPDGPSLTATLADALVLDTNGDGGVGEGDTVHYTVRVRNEGLGVAGAVEVVVVPDPQTALVVGTGTASQGTVTSGHAAGDDTFVVQLGDVPALGEAIAGFDVVVRAVFFSPPPLVVQGVVSTSFGAPFGTDDPDTPALGDATVTALVPRAAAGGDGPWPEITLIQPPDAGEVATPTDVVALLAPTSGEAILRWRVVTWPADGPETDGFEVASGDGAPAGSTLGQLDPTGLPDGLWRLRLEVVDTAGLVGLLEASYRVHGAYKPGQVEVGFTDLVLPIGVGDLELVRTWRSVDKARVGDFGHGWRLDLRSVRVQTNGALGDGGWGQATCGGSFVITQRCFLTTRPHVAVVTWPDGRQEVFDFTPEPTSSLFPWLAAPAFTPRPGTTSTLEVAPGEGAAFWDEDTGVLEAGLGGQGVYDPQRFVLTDREGRAWLLDKQLGLVERTDAWGNRLQLDADGITSTLGPDVTFERDADGRIQRLVLPDGHDVTYTYDPAGDLVRVRDPAGDADVFTYAAGHALLAWGPEGRPPEQQLGWTGDRVVDRRDAHGVGVASTWDTTLLTLTEVGPDPRLTTTTSYDLDGRPVLVEQDVDGTPYVTVIDYDALGRPERVTHPSGAVELLTWDPHGFPETHLDRDGTLTTWVRSPQGTPVEIWVDAALVQQNRVGPRGEVLEVREGTTPVATFQYDASGRVEALEDGRSATWTVAYDPVSALPSRITTPAGREVTVTRDPLGRPLTRVDALGRRADYDWDAAGRLTERTDALGQRQSFEYDDRGLLVAAVDKRGLRVTRTWDDAGRLATQTDRNGDTLTVTWDAAGRLASVTGPGVALTYAWDPLGRLVSATSEGGAIALERTWDATGLRREVSSTPWAAPQTLTWARDPGGRLVGTDSGTLQTTLTWDARGDLAALTASGVGTFSFASDDVGRPLAVDLPNGARIELDYLDGKVVHQAVTVAGAPRLTRALTWDADDLPALLVDDHGAHTFTHDALGRLLSATHPATSGLTDEAYTWDAEGRRTSWSGHAAPEVAHDLGDRLVRDAAHDYTWDDEGQRLRRDDRGTGAAMVTSWDAVGQLVQVDADGATWTFHYDALGRRVAVEGPAGDEVFVYDGDHVRAVLDGAGALTAEYVTGPRLGEVLAWRDAALGLRYAVRDELGTPIAWLDGAGAVVAREARDAFGVRAAGPPATVAPYGFTGHAEDPTGLVWARARPYEPSTGTFLREDRRLLTPRFGYADGSPLVHTDPTGEIAELAALGRAAVATAPAASAAPRPCQAPIAGSVSELLLHVRGRRGPPYGPVGGPFDDGDHAAVQPGPRLPLRLQEAALGVPEGRCAPDDGRPSWRYDL